MRFIDEISKYFLPHFWRQDEPDSHEPIKYDPEFGFNEPRPIKERKATFQEMESANLEASVRDECAHLHIAYRTCLKSNTPIWWRCNGYANELKNCYFNIRIDDMKDFERERRLNARERRQREAASS